MKKQKKMGKGVFVIGGIVILLVIIVLFVFSGRKTYAQEEVDAFAQCLTDKGAVMYGAFWCPHCARTKKRFGSSFQYIKYVECDPRGDNEQSELCLQKGIEAYDTWEFTDGSRVVGEPTFDVLGEKSGCSVPEGQNG